MRLLHYSALSTVLSATVTRSIYLPYTMSVMCGKQTEREPDDTKRWQLLTALGHQARRTAQPTLWATLLQYEGASMGAQHLRLGSDTCCPAPQHLAGC
eukprot:COSAG01_NODE_3912_length_5546_cov_49.202680_4_plen_98_part_00